MSALYRRNYKQTSSEEGALQPERQGSGQGVNFRYLRKCDLSLLTYTSQEVGMTTQKHYL